MRKQNLFNGLASIALVVALAFGVQSCKKDSDPCDDVTCQNGGTCDDGTCYCDDGYEGGNCETEWRDKAEGTFIGTENCGVPDQLSVVGSSTGSSVFRVNLTVGGVVTFYADFTNSTAFTIPSQSIASGQANINGSGSVSGSTITMSYTITYTNGDPSDICSFTGTN